MYLTLPVSSMPVKGVFDDFDAYSHGTHFSSGSKMTKSVSYTHLGDITSFQGNLQCSIKRARKVNEGEYDLSLIHI